MSDNDEISATESVSNSPIRKKYKKTDDKKNAKAGNVPAMIAYFKALAAKKYCTPYYDSNETLTCTCLEILSEDDAAQAVAAGALQFLKMAKPAQQLYLMTALQYSQESLYQDAKHRVFILPIDYSAGGVEADTLGLLQNHRVCKSAMMRATYTGRGYWKTCEDAIKRGQSPKHKLTGQDSNRAKQFTSHVAPFLREFLEDMEDLAEPRATRLVRETTGVGVRDEETGKVYLAPNVTKRNLYVRFCHERGWKMISDAKNNFEAVKREDENWSDGEPKEICCWTAFRQFWKTEFPNLHVRRPTEDICSLCYNFAMAHKYGTRTVATLDSDSDGSDHEVGDEVGDAEGVNSDEAPVHSIEHRENQFIVAARHVTEAQAMRKFAQEKTAQAKADALQNRPRNETTKTLFADFSQGAELPYFGSEQPGETYYYSPLTMNIFGVVDCCLKEDHLHAYVYDESEGKKGGSNVCSLLMKHFHERNLLNSTDPYKELVLIMDNCSGQNKNKMVLRLVVYLVEKGYFASVTFAFLIVGHTKNPCDRLFNLAKLTYRKSNCYTHEEFMEKIGENQHVSAYPVTAADMKDYNKFFDVLYGDFKAAKTLKWQVFSACNSNLKPTLMTLATSTLPDAETLMLELMKKKKDREKHFNDEVRLLPKPGLRPIKQVELFEKFRPLVPEHLQDAICPKPTAEVMAMVRADKKGKRVNKKNTASYAAAS